MFYTFIVLFEKSSTLINLMDLCKDFIKRRKVTNLALTGWGCYRGGTHFSSSVAELSVLGWMVREVAFLNSFCAISASRSSVLGGVKFSTKYHLVASHPDFPCSNHEQFNSFLVTPFDYL
jgi:hypothetical protein